VFLHLKFGGKKTAAKSCVEEEEPVAKAAIADRPGDRFSLLETFETAPVSRKPAPTGGAPRIKTYTAESMPKAIFMARRELGEDAILIQSKKIDRPADPSKQYEVTFGLIPGGEEAPPEPEPRPPAAIQPEEESPRNAELAAQLGALRRELQTLQSMFLHSSMGKGSCVKESDGLPSVYSVLVRNNVDPDIAADLQRAVEERRRNSTPGRDDARTLLAEHLESVVRTDSSLGGGASKPVVLVGSPGAGKTTAIMKLALEFGIKRGRTVEILSMHRGRPEVNSALETMTGLLGIRTQTLSSVEAFEPALARPRATGTLVLVDTNGYGSGSIDEDRGFASMVDSEQAAEVHLVLPAAWHPTSLRQAVDRFEIFHPTRLLYTMVDQAAVFGPMIEEPLRTGKGLSFAGSGPAGSGTLLPISLQWLLGRIWESSEERTR